MLRALPFGFLFVALTAGLSLPAQATETPAGEKPKASPEDVYELQRLLVDTIDEVERNYVQDISRRELIEAAIEGVLKKLDPYSNYISPNEMREFRTSVESEFGGIGIQIVIDKGRLKVLSPLVGTPAYRAGIMAGDIITEINGRPALNIGSDEAVERLKGPEGSQVTLTILHPGKSDTEKVTVTREVVHIQTALGDHRRADDSWDYMLDAEKRIGYIRLTAFSRNTAAELRAALNELTKESFRGLVLDLRFNPGGLLTSAIEVCDLFIAEGRIVSTKGRNTPERSWDAKKEGTFEGFPMVVLVNGYSASASEIVAACLQDHKRAVIMGERTWGKGSVQNVIELEHENGEKFAGSALKLTTASYYRPSGKNIHRFPDAGEKAEWGVMPDDGYLAELSRDELDKLDASRRARDIAHGRAAGTAATETKETQPGDEKNVVKESEETAGGEKLSDIKVGDAKPFIDGQLRMAIDYLSSEVAQK